MTPSDERGMPPTQVCEEAHQLLDDLRVADLSDSIAGQFATRLLADHGATVVLVEPPTGSPVRGLPPFWHAPEHAAPESLLFRHLNTGKDSVCLGEDRLAALRRDANAKELAYDVIVVSDHAAASRAADLFPDVCVAAVTDFAETGPYAQWAGSEIIHQALSGSMYYNGRADDRPLYGTGHRAYYAAGLHLYIRIVSDHIARLQGRPFHDRLCVSVHEAAAAMEQNFSTQWAYSKTIPARGEWNRPKGRVRCRDGWLAFFASGSTRTELFTALGAAEAADDPRFTDWLAFVRNIAEACALLNAGAATLTQQEILAAAIRDKLVLSPMRRLGELFTEDHLVARDYWRTDPDSRTILGPMWRLDRSRVEELPVDEQVIHPDTHEVTASPEVDLSRAGWRTDQGHAGPLSGLRVADFTSAWSGPMATRVLAALGAEVIKVEGPQRMDGWRGDRRRPFHPDSYPDSDPGRRPYNRNAWFNTQNTGKKSIAIDLKQKEGVSLALDLIAVSDVVISNFSPGTMQRIGLGFDTLRAVNPAIVMVEMSAFGDSGPLREHRGLGQTMEAMSGISYLIGYAEDREPLGSGSAYLDPMGGLAGAAAAVTALLQRQQTGTAQRVEVPQRESAMQWIGEKILDAVENGVAYEPAGNDVSSAFPHDAYQTEGVDQWVAIAVFDEQQWLALCTVCEWHEWRADKRLRGLPGRLAKAEEITQAINKAARTREKLAFATELQSAGVPAAPIQDGKDLYNDPQLRSRGWFTRLSHGDVGTRDYPGVPVEINGALSRPSHAAPQFAEHTRAVLSDLLHLDDQVIDAHLRAGVTALPDTLDDEPAAPALRS